MTGVFVNLTLNPNDFTLDSELMDSLQKYVCIEYSKNIKTESVNEARQVLFTQNLRNLENIPPTMNALYQHARRSILVEKMYGAPKAVHMDTILDRLARCKQGMFPFGQMWLSSGMHRKMQVL